MVTSNIMVSMKNNRLHLVLTFFFIFINSIFPQEPTSKDSVIIDVDDSLEFTITSNLPESIDNDSQDSVKISEETITSFNETSVTQVLRKGGNISIKQYGAYGSASSIYLRSFTGSTVAILVDGIQVNSSQTGEFDLNQLPINDIETIEIVRGASDAKYAVSGAAGGIINIITKKNFSQKFGCHIDFSNSSFIGKGLKFFDTQNIFTSLFGNNENIQWKFSGNFVNALNKFSYTSYDNTKQIRQNNEAQTLALQSSIIYQFKNESKLTTSASFYAGDINTPGTYTSTSYGNQKDLSFTFNSLLTCPFIFNGLADSNNQLSYKYNKTNYNEDFLSDFASSKSLHNLHSISYLTNFSFYFTDIFSYTPSLDINLSILDSTNCSYNNNDIFQSDFGFSNSFEIILNNINLYPSCKFLFRNGNFVPIPKFGSKFKILSNKDFTSDFSFNLYRMFTFPTLNQLFWEDSKYACGNKDLNNEDGFGSDIILNFTTQNTKNDLTIFFMYYKDKIQWQNHNGKWTPTNIGKACYFGGHISSSWKINSYFTLTAKYDLNLSYLLTGDLTLKDNKRIMYTPVHIATSDINFNYKNFSALLSCSFTSKRFISNLNYDYLKPYFLMDLSLEYKLKDKITIYTLIKNITNTSYFEIENYPMPGLSAKIGSRIKL